MNRTILEGCEVDCLTGELIDCPLSKEEQEKCQRRMSWEAGRSRGSHWLNTKIVTHPDLEKPCIKLGYCPYGQLVEEFPLHPNGEYTKLSCALENESIIQFGHDCPVHYHAELVKEE